MSTRTIRAAAMTACLAAMALAAPAAHAGQQLYLDFYEAPSDGAAGPVTSTASVPNGQRTLVTVKGTVSAYRNVLWEQPPGWQLCGTPEAAPQFASPATTNGMVGTDAETNFARPLQANRFCAAFPRHQSLFEMDLGSGFLHYEPMGGAVSSPAASHEYTYLIVGQGKPVSFREEDVNTTDNYGRYSITLFDKDNCKKDGWKAYGGLFKNQGDCVSYFATKGKNPPAGSVPDPNDMPEDLSSAS